MKTKTILCDNCEKEIREFNQTRIEYTKHKASGEGGTYPREKDFCTDQCMVDWVIKKGYVRINSN